MIGRSIGTYEILSRLGAGGMGEVYRATDTSLKRDVAIKILPPSVARDPDRVARFRREAQALASLNHPNIGAIYDVDSEGDAPFLVLELVEGETLDERIARGPLSPNEVVDIGRQIAEGLEAAHDKGIVHRDLKPANVKITPDGRVKLLDFGIAKMREPGGSPGDLIDSPTVTSLGAATGAGIILGTASYMSPEQARGQEATRQTDIWAFGCVLLEMLTGRRAFSGDTASDTIARILTSGPDWTAGRVPEPFRRIVERCLAKDVRRRFRDAGDVRLELEDALAAGPTAPGPQQRRSPRTLPLFALLMLAIATALWAWLRPTGEAPAPMWTATLLSGPELAYGPRVSPDGNTIAFQAIVDGMSQVAVMNPISGNWTLLTDERDAGLVSSVNWSTDGTRLFFAREEDVFSVPALGGEPRLLLEDAGFPEALPDGSLLVRRTNAERRWQLYHFRPDAGDLQPLDALLEGTAGGGVLPTTNFRAMPGGNEVVFVGSPASSPGEATGLHLLDLRTNRARPIPMDLHGSPYVSGLAVNPLDDSILAGLTVGDLQQVVSVPTAGPASQRVVLTLTNRNGYLDMAPDGSVYIDQVTRPMQVVRFSESDRAPETLATVPLGYGPTSSVLELPDGRFLLTDLFGGRRRLLAARPSGEVVPFVETEEESSGPAALIGDDRVAFVLGRPPGQTIAIASIRDGRIVGRIETPARETLAGLSASDDGERLFYSDAGSIWSIPVAGGEARKLGDGDGVAFDPLRRDLVVQLETAGGTTLGRMPTTGGAVTPIPLSGEARFAGASTLGPHAVRRDGALVFPATFRDNWFFGAAVLDPATGLARRLPLRYDGDFFTLSWNPRGEIVAAGFLLRSAIWRFRPLAQP